MERSSVSLRELGNKAPLVVFDRKNLMMTQEYNATVTGAGQLPLKRT